MLRHFFLDSLLPKCIFSLILELVDVVGHFPVVLVWSCQRYFLLGGLLIRLQFEDRFVHVSFYEIFLLSLVQLVNITWFRDGLFGRQHIFLTAMRRQYLAASILSSCSSVLDTCGSWLPLCSRRISSASFLWRLRYRFGWSHLIWTVLYDNRLFNLDIVDTLFKDLGWGGVLVSDRSLWRQRSIVWLSQRVNRLSALSLLLDILHRNGLVSRNCHLLRLVWTWLAIWGLFILNRSAATP